MSRTPSSSVVLVVALCALPWVCAADEEGAAVVVVGLGEPLLVGEAEAVVEAALATAGARLVDERGLPEADTALGDRQVPFSRELVEALRPAAAFLVLVRAEYLGGRELAVAGGSDVAHQARLTLTLVDLSGEGEPPQSILNERVEYTTLSVADAVRRSLQPGLPALVRRLGLDPARPGGQ